MSPLRNILGVAGVPSHRTSASQWCKKHNIQTFRQDAHGGKAEYVHLSDLPDAVRRAVLERTAERLGLEPGDYDEAEHAKLLEATPAMRAKAERLAEIARFLVARRKAGMGRAEAFAAVRARFGDEFTSDASLDRLARRVDWVGQVSEFQAAVDMGFRHREGPGDLRDAGPGLPHLREGPDFADDGQVLAGGVFDGRPFQRGLFVGGHPHPNMREVRSLVHGNLQARQTAAAIDDTESEIGHMKTDGRLARCFLKGTLGDALFAVLCGCGRNIRKILAHLRALLSAFIALVLAVIRHQQFQRHSLAAA